MDEELEQKQQLYDATATLTNRLQQMPNDALIAEGRDLLDELRKAREYERMEDLAEMLSRLKPKDPVIRRLYAQSLIDSGKPSIAIDVLSSLARRLSKDNPEWAETKGLLGRANKQIFIETPDKSSSLARQSVKSAIEGYLAPFKADPSHYWHGINLCAVLTAARRHGVRAFRELDPQRIAEDVLNTLAQIPAAKRDSWYWATAAEAHFATGDWERAEKELRKYVMDPKISPFNLASTLRQFREVWELQRDDSRGAGLIQLLEARLARMEGCSLDMSLEHVRTMRQAGAPTQGQLERVLGDTEFKTLEWYRTGLDRAAAVSAVRLKLGKRIGTGFAIRAGDLGIEPYDEILVLTNYHVVNASGDPSGMKPEQVQVVFEAVDPSTRYNVSKIVWSSSYIDGLDATLLQLTPAITGITPLPVADDLPQINSDTRVYLIGHPRGEELQVSLQDNLLLDHEGPPKGKPPDNDIIRIHYHAPTARGSSGSPVFNDDLWEVIALHHAGGKFDPPNEQGLPKLNGKPGNYSANEGMWIQAIKHKIKADI